MGDEKLNAFALMLIESDILDSLISDEIFNDFVLLENRKKYINYDDYPASHLQYEIPKNTFAVYDTSKLSTHRPNVTGRCRCRQQ